MPNLVLDGGRRLLGIAVAVVGKLLRPKVLHDRVLHVINHLFSILFIGIHAIDTEQGCVRILKQGEKRIREDVFHARAPCILPNLLKGRHEAAYHEVAFVVADILHHVKRNRVLEIKRSEVDDIFYAILRDVIENSINRPPMRVNKGESFAVPNILNRHVLKQGRLAHAGLADDVHMAVAVLRLDAERDALPARVSRREVGNAFRILHYALV